MSEENTLKLASVDYVDSKCSGGELKAKTWLCGFTAGGGMDCSFDFLSVYEQPGVEVYRTYGENPKEKAIIKFTEEKSQAEVNRWLMFEAKLTSAGDNIIGDNETFIHYNPFAICPWKSDNSDEWPEAN